MIAQLIQSAVTTRFGALDEGAENPFTTFLATPFKAIAKAHAETGSQNLFAWPLVETLFLLVLGGAIAWVLAATWSRTLSFLWASGLDPRRRLAHSVPILRLFLALTVIILALGPLEIGRSLTSAALLGGGMIIIATVGNAYLRDIVGGVAIAMRRPFTIGDPVATDTVAGRVVDINLTRVRLQTPDGALVDVPARTLASGRIITSNGRRSLPTAVVVRVRHDADAHRAQADLLDQVYLSAYVDAAAPISVEALGDGTARIQATPIHPDDTDELRSDLAARAASLAGRG